MGGRIWVESVPGKGSAFAFNLTARILDGAVSPPAGDGRAAFVAVDGPATRSVITQTLGESGYSVQRAAPGADIAGAAVIFGSAEWIESTDLSAGGVDHPAVICVAGVGNSRVDRLLKSGLAQGVLSQPVSSTRVREIMRAVESGTLSSLQDSHRSDPAAELPDLQELSVLVADDSPVNREVVTEALTRLKARTHTVEDGVQALEAFKTGTFDIVLMDCSMPEMDGFAATRAIRLFEQEERSHTHPCGRAHRACRR